MIAITGGGTGGHLAVAKTIKEELNKRGLKPIFIGSNFGQDREWFENDTGFREKYFFKIEGVVNKKGVKKLSSLVNILKYTSQCRNIFKEHKIEKIFSVGGYSAAPASIASILFGKELYIHEQNSVTGTLNKALKPFSKAFFCSFDETSPIKDYPVSEIFFKNARIRKNIKSIIFLGGSQGAVFINNFAILLAKELNKRGIKIIHQCGKRDFKRVKDFYQKEKIEAEVFDFSLNIASFLKKADFAISRAGAGSLFTLAASALPSLFIPYPYAAKDHQYFNAKYLSDRNLAFLKREEELKKEDLFNILQKDIEPISRGLKELISPNAAEKIADYILNS